MALKRQFDCYACGKKALSRNDTGLNKKLLGEQIEQYMCLSCLAAYLEVAESELIAKIEEFKAEGCKLFG